MATEKVYYKKAVKFNVGVRKNIDDWKGLILTENNPYVEVPKDDLRAFKIANKEALIKGFLLEAEEPSLDWETNNAVTDQQIDEFLKAGYMALKKKIQSVDSLPVLNRFLEAAKTQNKPKKTIELIQERVEEFEEDINFSVDPSEMKGVE